ncbi:NAD-dependent epimerase/dehydratase family protein [Candidatus Peribacteria bacterium]|nr:MAG: NAD-dependent epimerase/dehydratase family protein [Candidatus Peribacteria bacterium]
MKILVTGSAGLIGSEAVKHYCTGSHDVHGIDNDMRKYFFGEGASTDWNRKQLEQTFPNYTHHTLDIRDLAGLETLFKAERFDRIIHTAAQPSHDWAAKEPLTDFGVNAQGTLNLLELTRLHSPEAVFIFTSTNKVYGDTPNALPLLELETRYELPMDHPFYKGIDESMSIDHSTHSVFGASKVAADVMVQEYGKYFGMKTGVFRGGCLTGPSHSGAKLHGFLAYLVLSIAKGQPYTIMGYKGKQVRDNIHSSDVISAFDAFADNPRCGEAYNIGGTRFSNISMVEAIRKVEALTGNKADVTYTDENRIGDHIWYISDMSKFQSHYPAWKQQYDIDTILEQMVASIPERNNVEAKVATLSAL